MPIRMEKDPQKNSGGQQPRDPGRQNTGGLGSLAKILPFILMFLFKKPKLLIPVLVIAAGWYFFFGGAEMLSGGNQQPDNGFDDSMFSLGANFDQEKYDKTEVFAPLAAGSWNGMPSKVSLEAYAPSRGQQGRQGSCVGWASAYSARTILHSRATGKDPNSVAFSPAYLYNQIALEGCQGAYMLDAMKTMYENGGVPYNDFKYDEASCRKYPQSNHLAKGRQFRIKGYNRLTLDHDRYTPDILAIKQNIAQGAPVVIGMQVGGTFMSRMVGQKVWRPTQKDYTQRGFSGHAMTVIGYDDNLEGGAFQIMNSWGEKWGDRGFGWVRYRDFETFVKEAYGLYPMGSADTDKFNDKKLAVEFGLLDLKTEKTIPMERQGDMSFRTTRPISKGDKFKVLVANSIECYIYVFGQETDGSSYVLFPYTEKHSPYCGITGTRLFPRDYSMVADDIGNTDYMAVVVSKQELNFNNLNKAINSSSQSSYAAKLKEALGNERIENVSFQAGNTVSFAAEAGEKNIVGVVLALDKR